MAADRLLWRGTADNRCPIADIMHNPGGVRYGQASLDINNNAVVCCVCSMCCQASWSRLSAVETPSHRSTSWSASSRWVLGHVLKPLWVGDGSCTEATGWVLGHVPKPLWVGDGSCTEATGWVLGHVPKPLWVGDGSCTEATVGGCWVVY